MTEILNHDLEALIETIEDGSKLAVFKDGGGVAMAATRTLIRRGVKDLHIVTVPTSGLQTDMLIGAGCVATVETSGVTLSEFGQAPCFGRAIKAGMINVMDATCPAIYAGMQAGEKGIPFMPFRGLIGSDILRHRVDWQVIDNPFTDNDPIVALPAIRPDVALLHVPLADRYGNVWIGMWHELKMLAHAAKDTLVTCEAFYEGNLFEDPQLAPATLSSLYVTAIAQAEHGAWPLELPGHYPVDGEHLNDYRSQASSADGMRDYLDEYVFANNTHANSVAV